MKFAVTIFAILIGLAVILGVMSNASKTNAPQDTPAVVADDVSPQTLDSADGAKIQEPVSHAPAPADEPAAATAKSTEAATDTQTPPTLQESNQDSGQI